MIIIGDIGNTETKICLVGNKLNIIKKILIPSKGNKLFILDRYFKKLTFLKLKRYYSAV